MLLINIIKASVVRIVLLVHSFLAVWRAYSIAGDARYWLLAVADGAFVVEGFVTIIARKGMEYKWFCPCFFFYLGGTIPAIWLLELDRRGTYVQKAEGVNTTVSKPQFSEIYGVSIPVELPPETWVVVIEQLLLYFMIIGRWLLPRGNISRNELSQLLFVFIGMASDITELFTLFDEALVRESLELTYAILIIWTVSLLQFCFVLTATKNTKRARVALRSSEEENERKAHGKCAACVTSEVWSILIAMFMQDVPFLVLRVYTIVTLSLINYSIIFFTAKNVLVILLLMYRLVVICGRKEKEDDNDIENTVVVDQSKVKPRVPVISTPFKDPFRSDVYRQMRRDMANRHRVSNSLNDVYRTRIFDSRRYSKSLGSL